MLQADHQVMTQLILRGYFDQIRIFRDSQGYRDNMERLEDKKEGQWPPKPDFKLIKTVGTGSFGRAHLALHTRTNTYVVLKVLRKLDVIKLKQVEHTLDEKRILEALCNSCPFLVHLYGSFMDCEYLYLVLEYIQGGELFTYLQNADKLDNKSAKFYAAEVVLAFEYLHSANVVYRDLKPENLLIDSRGHIRVTDFGFTKHLEEDETHTLSGTPDYLAPEVIQAKGYGKAVDWWALGILIYEMIASHPPFFDDDPFHLYEKIVACHLSRRYGNLRDGALDIKMHPWFQGINWDAMWELRMDAPYIPDVEGDGDTSHFDEYEEDSELGLPHKDSPSKTAHAKETSRKCVL
ncbi:hypothetical protein CcCBS67573_g06126 [Chytriomyces confervae]|uniref:cAMP-dependent protein kinase n=1 Tax=Chytriomyces confervae TaxID=246404 RepID=A0A507F5T5_9FUNG|nr:hypothetical protein CcCBS67573_g06126 [Chytriomyces confervae]